MGTLARDLRQNARSVGHSVDVQVGQKVRQRRSSLGLTQEELAASVGITYQQLQKYERGSNRISASRLYELSWVLMVPISYFFQGIALPTDNTSPKNSSETSSRFKDRTIHREEAELMRSYSRIPSREIRKKVRSLVKDIADTTGELSDASPRRGTGKPSL